MDYHRQFRMNAMNQGRPALVRPQHNRFPLTSMPRVHLQCAGENAEPCECGMEVRKPMQPVPQNKDSAEVRAQVKQLQFWLRVFSRFCQKGEEED
jgi:hypothetical protein